MAKPYLSVIVTNFNEEINLKRGGMDEIENYLKKQKFTYEMILVDDGSTDSTLALLEKFSKGKSYIRVIKNPHMGKAAGVITGALKSTGEIILFTDTDQSTPISEFAKFIPYFSRGYDVVIGSRNRRKGAPLFRQILAMGMVVFRTLILQLPYRDSQCGFKAFSRRAADRIFMALRQVHPVKPIDYPTTNPGFDLEILYLARKCHYLTAEVPVTWEYRESKRVTFVKDAINGIRELFLVRYRSLANVYRI